LNFKVKDYVLKFFTAMIWLVTEPILVTSGEILVNPVKQMTVQLN